MRVKSLLFMTPRVFPQSHTHTHTHTLGHTHTCMYDKGHFPMRLWRRPIWESSTPGALTFHSEVKGGDGVCVRGCVNEGQRAIGGKERERRRRERVRQKEKLHCFEQIAPVRLKERRT